MISAAALSGSACVSFCGDTHLAVFDHDHDLMHKTAVAAREFEDFAEFDFPAFSVFALGVFAHQSSISWSEIPLAKQIRMPAHEIG